MESSHPSLTSVFGQRSQEPEFSEALHMWKIQNHFRAACKTPKYVPLGSCHVPFITSLLEVLAETGEGLLLSLLCGPVAV